MEGKDDETGEALEQREDDKVAPAAGGAAINFIPDPIYLLY